MSQLTCFMTVLFLALPLFAKLNVVATTSDIQALVRAVGAEQLNLTVIAKGSQDPHYIEAKPSYMVKMRDADLLVSNGLSLEVGWLPSLIRGARNSKINPGARGFLELGSLIEPIDKAAGSLTRARGDVHPEGNPHFTLDPMRVGDLAVKVAERLAELDPKNRALYESRARTYRDQLVTKTQEWQARIQASGVIKVITYHPSLNYFLQRFELIAASHLEEKPGIPPTAQHILKVIDTIKREKIKWILVDNFFDTKIADRVAKDVPTSKVRTVGVAVDSGPGLATIDDVIEKLVQAVEGK